MRFEFLTADCPDCDATGHGGRDPAAFCLRCDGLGRVLQCTACAGTGEEVVEDRTLGAVVRVLVPCEHCDGTGAEPPADPHDRY